jgi:hypothetical protein
MDTTKYQHLIAQTDEQANLGYLEAESMTAARLPQRHAELEHSDLPSSLQAH